MSLTASDDLLQAVGNRTFTTVPADPPWQFQNRTGKMAPEHKRLSRYPTMILFGVRGKNARTLQPGRSQENIIITQKREHSRKPDEQYKLIEACSWCARIELFARGPRDGWFVWGNQSKEYSPTWHTYSNHSRSNGVPTEQIRFEYDAAQ